MSAPLTSSNPTAPREQLQQFLTAVFPETLPPGITIEVRALRKDAAPRREFYASIEALVADYAQLQRWNETDGYAIYVGTALRNGRDGTKGGCYATHGLWADFDGDATETTPDALTANKTRIREHLSTALPAALQPTMIVDSGRGLQGFWLFPQSWGFEKATRQSDVDAIERVLKGLRPVIQSDPARTDVSSIMRLPGFVNVKYPHKPMARIESLDLTRRFTLEDFKDYALPARETPATNAGDHDIVRKFKAAGLYLDEAGDGEKHYVTCPWKADHTGDSGATETAIFVPDDESAPGFKCLHAHCADKHVGTVYEFFKSQATPPPAAVTMADDAPVFEEDILTVVERAIREQGYGGELTPALIVYLAMTTRLLADRDGGMPAHAILLASSSGGKSYTVGVARKLFPESVVHEIPAGSARALIYDNADLRHRVLFFGEVDSLPDSDEDSSAGSAIRNLLQDGYLSYCVVEKGGKDGKFATRRIEREGPTVLITTSTRRLKDTQLGTRMFELEVPEDVAKIRAALLTQARLVNRPAPAVDPRLVDFQADLQAHAPWRVVVPFTVPLATLIGRGQSAPRVQRDFARLIALIQAVAILRHPERKVTAAGALVAQIEDYETVRGLVERMYETSVSGATETVRRVCEAVGGGCTTVQAVADKLPDIHKTTVQRNVNRAIGSGWLINRTPVKNRYDLAPGETIPDRAGLPSATRLQEEVLTGLQAGEADSWME